MRAAIAGSGAQERIAYLEREVARLRREMDDQLRTLRSNFLLGRLRTDRTAPATSTDVVQGIDQEYDALWDGSGNAGYVCADVNGALKWGKITIDFGF